MPIPTMDIDRCNSIFELFSAFNFAYAIFSKPNGNGSIVHSNSFVDMVDYHLIKPFTVLDKTFKEHEETIARLKNDIKLRRGLAASTEEKEACNKLTEEVGAQETAFRECRIMAEDEKQSAKDNIDGRFPYASFLFGLFCISVLVLAASQAPHKHVTLVILDVSIVLTYVWLRRQLNAKKVFTYWDLSWRYFWILLGCIAAHFILGIYLSKSVVAEINRIENDYYIKRVVVFLNVVAPFSHFIYYMWKFKKKTKQITDDSETRLVLVAKMEETVQKKLDEMKAEIRDSKQRTPASRTRKAPASPPVKIADATRDTTILNTRGRR
jgi:hypothetical protein